MKFILPLFLVGACAFAGPKLLPAKVNVYIPKQLVSLKPREGFEPRELPVFNHFVGEPGGYVVVYTNDAKFGVYSLSRDVHVAGLVRLMGRYTKNYFMPFEAKKNSKYAENPQILAIIHQYFPKIKNKCWVSGDTSNWLRS